MDTQATKSELIKMIMAIESEQLLKKVKNFLKQEVKNEPNGSPPLIASEPEPEWVVLAKQPVPESIDLDELAKEQGYDGKKLAGFFKKRDQKVWEDENFEDLVQLLQNDK